MLNELSIVPTLTMWRPYLNHNIKYDNIMDHSTNWDMLGIPEYPPLLQLEKGKRKALGAFSMKFLVTRNWQDRMVGVFSPMLFTVVATLVNYHEILYTGKTSASLAPIFGSTFGRPNYTRTQINFEKYFENQVAIALIAVFIIGKIKIKSTSNSLTVSDSFCGALMLGLVLSLFRSPEVCLFAQIILALSLGIPLANFVGFLRAKKKWLENVETSKVQKGTMKPSKDANMLHARYRLEPLLIHARIYILWGTTPPMRSLPRHHLSTSHFLLTYRPICSHLHPTAMASRTSHKNPIPVTALCFARHPRG
jgi:hypothetical protein